jgi:hypothetical protein
VVDAQRDLRPELALDVRCQAPRADAEHDGSSSGLGREGTNDVEGGGALVSTPNPVSMKVLVALEQG